MKLIFFSIVLFGLCFAAIALRLILRKDKEFRGTCASQNPFAKNPDGSCSLCGQKSVQDCPEEDEED